MDDGGKRLGNKNERHEKKTNSVQYMPYLLPFFNERSINESRVVSF